MPFAATTGTFAHMGLVDRLIGGMKWTYLEPDLSGQGIVGTWPAGERKLGVSATGGRLVLTDQALIFCPLDLEQTKKVLSVVMKATRVPGAGLAEKLMGLSRDSVLVIPLDEIESVKQVGAAKLVSPPSFELRTRSGSVHDFGVLAATLSPNFSARNNDALADLLFKLTPRIR